MEIMDPASGFENIQTLNHRHKLSVSRSIIRQALLLGRRPFISTKFGPDSAVLLHLLVAERPDIPVVWVDTGYNTRATLRFAEELRERLRLNLHIFWPEQKALEWPPSLDDPEHAAFTRRVKLEPFNRALEALQPDLWFSGLRREQTAYRAGLDAFNRSPGGLLKVAPLLDWTQADMDRYMEHHGLPSEPDYYDPTKGEPRRECGLHLAF